MGEWAMDEIKSLLVEECCLSPNLVDSWLAEHDAEVKAEAWDKGFASGKSRAMRHMSDEPTLSLDAPNPYRAGGER